MRFSALPKGWDINAEDIAADVREGGVQAHVVTLENGDMIGLEIWFERTLGDDGAPTLTVSFADAVKEWARDRAEELGTGEKIKLWGSDRTEFLVMRRQLSELIGHLDSYLAGTQTRKGSA